MYLGFGLLEDMLSFPSPLPHPPPSSLYFETDFPYISLAILELAL